MMIREVDGEETPGSYKFQRERHWDFALNVTDCTAIFVSRENTRTTRLYIRSIHG